MNSNNTKGTCNHHDPSSADSARRLPTERHPSCEPASSYYLRATTMCGLHIPEPKNTRWCGDPSSAQSEPHSSGTVVEPRVIFQLLLRAMITHPKHIRKNLKFGGLNTGWSITPHPSTNKASAPDRSLEGY